MFHLLLWTIEHFMNSFNFKNLQVFQSQLSLYRRGFNTYNALVGRAGMREWKSEKNLLECLSTNCNFFS